MLLVWMVSCLGFFVLVAYLEEPCFHALGFVSALNGDSLSLNVGPPWCCLWRQRGCQGWRVGAGMSSAGGTGGSKY